MSIIGPYLIVCNMFIILSMGPKGWVLSVRGCVNLELPLLYLKSYRCSRYLFLNDNLSVLYIFDTFGTCQLVYTGFCNVFSLVRDIVVSEDLSSGVLSSLCNFNVCVLEEFGDKCGLFPGVGEGGPFALFCSFSSRVSCVCVVSR